MPVVWYFLAPPNPARVFNVLHEELRIQLTHRIVCAPAHGWPQRMNAASHLGILTLGVLTNWGIESREGWGIFANVFLLSLKSRRSVPQLRVQKSDRGCAEVLLLSSCLFLAAQVPRCLRQRFTGLIGRDLHPQEASNPSHLINERSFRYVELGNCSQAVMQVSLEEIDPRLVSRFYERPLPIEPSLRSRSRWICWKL